jgi:hypothetical protein
VFTIDTSTGLFDLTIDGLLVFQGTVDNAHLIGASGIRYVAVHSGRGGAGTDSYFDDILVTATAAAPTSTSVGGIVEFPVAGSDSSSPPYAVIIGGATAALAALGLGIWFAGRRRLRRYN